MAFERTPYGAVPDPALPTEGVEDISPGALEGIDVHIEDDFGNSVPLDAPAAPDISTAAHNANLRDYLSEEELEKLAEQLLTDFESDKQSRSDLDEILRSAVEALGFAPDTTDKPFRYACDATHPLLAEAVVSAQAETYSIMCPPGGPVRTTIQGPKTPQLEMQARRIRSHMNWQCTQQMPEYYPEQDRLLLSVFLTGTGIKRVYWDSSRERPCSHFVKPENFFIDYYASDLETSSRYTILLRTSEASFLRDVSSGVYAPLDITSTTTPESSSTEDLENRAQGAEIPDTSVYEILEMYVDLSLPTDILAAFPVPYIVHLDKNSKQILSIRRNWDEGDPKYKKRRNCIVYRMIPGLGFWGYGYMHLIGGLAQTATRTMRRLVDAGTFANMPGGFKMKGVRTTTDDPISPGEWREIEVPANNSRDAFFPLPYREPSATLMNLLEFMVASGQKFANASKDVVSQSSNYGPVATTLALLEQGGKLMNSIHRRLLHVQSEEFTILASINKAYIGEGYPFVVEGGDASIALSDYDERIDVIPVADPDNPTEAQRTARAYLALQVAQQFPQEHNIKEALLRLYTAAGLDQPERLLAQPPADAKPADPIQENMAMLNGSPAAAADYQDHAAHITLHQMLLTNPQYNKLPAVALAAQAHIQEHLALKMRADFAAALGVTLPPPGEPLPPEIENQIAAAASSAAAAVTSKNISEETAAQNEEAMTDPAFRIQLQELELRKQELAQRDQNEDADRELKRDEIYLKARLEQEKINAQKQAARSPSKK